MVDGSVHTVASDIDLDVWTDMGTRNGLPMKAILVPVPSMKKPLLLLACLMTCDIVAVVRRDVAAPKKRRPLRSKWKNIARRI